MSDARPKRPFRKMLIIGAVVIPLALLAGAILSRSRAKFASPPLPVPNGFDDLVGAGEVVKGQSPRDLLLADEATLRAFVAPNGEALARARVGLGRTSRVPLNYSVESVEGHMKRSQSLRQVSRLLTAAGRLAEKEGRPAEAARDYRESIALGIDGTRGGLMMDALLGFACEAGGVDGLNRVADQLDAKHCRELSGELGPLDRGREEIAEVIARDYAWGEATADWRFRIAILYNAKTLRSLNQPAEKAAEASSRRAQLRLRTLLATLAIRACRLERGEDPPSMAALVPEYLPAIPRDPADGKPFRYKDEPGDGPLLELEPAPGPDDEPKPSRP